MLLGEREQGRSGKMPGGCRGLLLRRRDDSACFRFNFWVERQGPCHASSDFAGTLAWNFFCAQVREKKGGSGKASVVQGGC